MTPKVNIKNIFTIDLEDWYHANYNEKPFKSSISTVCDNTRTLLDLLDKFNTKATFFCLGQIAKMYPKLIKKIHSKGHEIACHGYNHQLVYLQNKNEFKKDVYDSKSLLEDLIGERVLGYRAPSWSITKLSIWSLKILEELQFTYDSSIYPMKTFLYGIKNGPRFPYIPILSNNPLDITEVPPSTCKIFGKVIGIGGGFFLRIFPAQIQLYFARRNNRIGHPFLIYIHPREIDQEQPRLQLGLKEQFIHYWGLRNTIEKLNLLLSFSAFIPIKQFLSLYSKKEFPKYNFNI